MSEKPEKLLAADEVYSMLVNALTEKRSLPPKDWSVVKLDEEVLKADKNYEPNQLLRQKDAILSALYYLVDFAVRMPERVDVSEKNERVREMCLELSAEIVKITISPDEVIARHGKLKSWLKAILAVQLCLIYREETERVIAEDDARKKAARLAALRETKPSAVASPKIEKWQSDLAKNIFQKMFGKSIEQSPEQRSEQQPSLF